MLFNVSASEEKGDRRKNKEKSFVNSNSLNNGNFSSTNKSIMNLKDDSFKKKFRVMKASTIKPSNQRNNQQNLFSSQTTDFSKTKNSMNNTKYKEDVNEEKKNNIKDGGEESKSEEHEPWRIEKTYEDLKKSGTFLFKTTKGDKESNQERINKIFDEFLGPNKIQSLKNTSKNSILRSFFSLKNRIMKSEEKYGIYKKYDYILPKILKEKLDYNLIEQNNELKNKDIQYTSLLIKLKAHA